MPLANFASWLDDWDLSLQTGTVSDGSRTVYLRGCRQFIDAVPTSVAVVAHDHPTRHCRR